jgi:predicted transcriptional regulator
MVANKIIHHDVCDKQLKYITNCAAALLLVVKHPQITAREISQEVGITERSVRLIIRDLDKGGYISKISDVEGSDTWWIMSGLCAMRRINASPYAIFCRF